MRHNELSTNSGLDGIPFERGAASFQLQILRTLLERDYLVGADWDVAIRDLLDMVAIALGPVNSMLGLWSPADLRWSAFTPDGQEHDEAQISRFGSKSVLEWVRAHNKPLLTLEDEKLLSAESISTLQVGSIMAAPVHWLEESNGKPCRVFAGCLYVHRTQERADFSPSDVQLLLDITRIAQPVLNLLKRFQHLKRDLEAERGERERLQHAAAAEYRLGNFRTLDSNFHRTVLGPLHRAGAASRLNVLLLGPSGSGKSHLAEAIHHNGSRQNGPFVVLDCAQVTSVETLSAELFGYAADSGYHNAPRHGRHGKARLAHQGTLFIDEIGCLPLELQQKLLRLIERGSFCPLGTSAEVTVDVQIIAATNEDLEAGVNERRFREDLFWRLNELVVRLPPLNERELDIPGLANTFLARARERTNRPEIQALSPQAMHRLLNHDWSSSGNIRGLEQTILRSIVLAPPGIPTLDAEHLRFPNPARTISVSPPPPRKTPVEPDPETAGLSLESIKEAIRQHGYATSAARSLGMTHRQLTWRLERAGLSVRDVLAQRP